MSAGRRLFWIAAAAAVAAVVRHIVNLGWSFT